MAISTGKHDKQIAAGHDRPVVQFGNRDLVPVTRLISEFAVTVIDGVLTTIRLVKAA